MRTGIKLLEFARSRYGLMISPFIQNFNVNEDAGDVFDPHRHDYYSLFLLKAGTMNLKLDSELICMKDESFILIGPGQVHHVLSTENIVGWIMAFDAKLIDKNSRTALQNIASTTHPLNLHHDDLSFFDNLLHIICREADDSQRGIFQLQLLHSLINVCFYKMIGLYESHTRVASGNYLSRPAELTQQFKDLLASNFVNIRKPSEYAALLNISVSHLNDVVKSVTGYSTSYFIRQESMAEAQRQLLYGTGNIEEIAAKVGYTDSKYFIRLFTKTIGQSPLQFRKSNGTNSLYRTR